MSTPFNYSSRLIFGFGSSGKPNNSQQSLPSGRSISHDPGSERAAAANLASLQSLLGASNKTKLSSTEEYMERTKKAAGYLRQIIHSQSCGGTCGDKKCQYTFQLLRHCEGCSRYPCPVPGCETSKKLMEHSRGCDKRKSRSTNFFCSSDVCLVCSLAFAGDRSTCGTIDEREEGVVEIGVDEIIQYNKVPFQDDPGFFARTRVYSDVESELSLKDSLSDESLDFNGNCSRRVRLKSFQVENDEN